MSGTSDLQTSLYTEPPNVLSHNKPYMNHMQTAMRFAAPVVNMTYVKSFQQPRIISTTFFTKERTTPISPLSDNDDYPERFALSPLGRINISPDFDNYPERYALSPIEEHDSERNADYEIDPDMPLAPVIVIEKKTVSRKPSKKPSSSKRLLTRLSKRTQRDYRWNSSSEAFEAEPNLILFDKKTGEKFYEEDAIKVGVPGSKSEERGSDKDDEVCAICQGSNSRKRNEIVFCDGCNIAVHQKCYGLTDLPPGCWFCRECKPQEAKGREKQGQSATPASPQNPPTAKRKRKIQEQSTHTSKRTRRDPIVVISDDEAEQEQKSSRQSRSRSELRKATQKRSHSATKRVAETQASQRGGVLLRTTRKKSQSFGRRDETGLK